MDKSLTLDSVGIVYIKATFNNTILTLTDETGKTLCWSSCGSVGFKGTRKSTGYAAQAAAEALAKKAISAQCTCVKVYLKGLGKGRDLAVRGLALGGLQVTSLVDITPIPHNGCRPPKKRRV
uniref:Small ribosomal subunit protein uS11c n=1 Tax=Chloroparvula japonica TaxID=1411623 RepID=A0A4D6C529_9CHLO|nr:ribosomal protein S11 [Chloroparvula japonica]QBX98784.1 ribosomal protein S11 [Chloroparvula japonica]